MADTKVTDLPFLPMNNDVEMLLADPNLGAAGSGKAKAEDVRTYMNLLNPTSQKEMKIFSVDTSNSYQTTFRVRKINANGSYGFNFTIPDDFVSLEELYISAVPLDGGAVGVDKQIDLVSNYAKAGEVYNTHSETLSPNLVDTGTLDNFFELDLSGVFSSIQPNDNCGVEVDHNAIGGDIGYLSIVLRYIRLV